MARQLTNQWTVPTLREVRQLAQRATAPAISIYMPTHRGSRDVREDPIRFKNCIGRARRALEQQGTRSSEATRLLKPAEEILKDPDLWTQLGKGLAVFVAPGQCLRFRAAAPFDDLTIVDSRFHLVPLLDAVQATGEFYVLAVSRKHVRLIHATPHGLQTDKLPDVPEGVGELFFDDDTTEQLQLHSFRAPSGAGRTAVFHGQGGTEQPQEERILHYFRAIDAHVTKRLPDPNVPLIFAGDGPLLPLYRRVNRHRALADEYVPGNPDNGSVQELYDRAWSIYEHSLHRGRRGAIAKVERAVGADGRLAELPFVLEKARQGQVDTLLVAARERRWGRLAADDPQRIEVFDDVRPGSEELVNAAVCATVQHDGAAWVLPRDHMPARQVTAAALRY